MKTSLKGRIALAVSEGVVNTAYLDSVRVWTFGVGHTKSAGPPDPLEWRGKVAPISVIMEVFERDLALFERGVAQALKVKVKQHEFDALVHFAFNIGIPGFKRSRLLKLLNAGERDQAFMVGFHGWMKPPELRGRRDKERHLARTGDYGSMVAPYYTADASGRLRRIGTIDIAKEMRAPTTTVHNTTSPQSQPPRTLWAWIVSLFTRS